MTIAIISPEPSQISYFIPNDSPLRYAVSVRVSAGDGTAFTQQPLTVNIPAGTHRKHFNELVVQASIDLLAGYGFVVSPSDIYFQPFDNGN